MLKYLITIILATIVFSQPTSELLYPQSLDSITINSIKFIDSLYFCQFNVRGCVIETCFWKIDTCFFVKSPVFVTDCEGPYVLSLYSRDGLILPGRSYPMASDRECWCNSADLSCPFVAGWELQCSPIIEYADDSVWFYMGIPYPPYWWLKPEFDSLPYTLSLWADSHWIYTCECETCFFAVSETTMVSDFECILTLPREGFYRSGYAFDSHPEELVLAPIGDTLGNLSDWAIWNLVWFPDMEIPSPYYWDWYDEYGDMRDTVYAKFGIPDLKVIVDYPYPEDSIDVSDSICISCCSGGCYSNCDSLKDYRYHFLLDSTAAWMTIEWDGGVDTVHYGEPGTFWYRPEDMSLPWRRFGVLADSTRLPPDYEGEVIVCMQDVTNEPVVAYGEPVHLHPRGVNPFMECEGVPNCCPSPPEPVCWSFNIIPGRITPTQSADADEINLSLDVLGDISTGFKLRYACPGEGTIDIYDILGRNVFNRSIFGEGIVYWGDYEIPAGIYFARIKWNGEKILRKIMVIK